MIFEVEVIYEELTGEVIPVPDYVKHDKPSRSWMIPRGCNKG